MGLLSFFSKRSNNKGSKTNGTSLKSHEYSSSTDEVRPTQEPLSRPRQKFSQTQLSLDTTSGSDDAPAPAPAVPRYRDETAERPRTAPNGTQSSTIWVNAGPRLRKTIPRGPPPVSFRMLKGGSVASETRPGSRGTESTTTDLPRVVHVHSRSNSMRSDSGGKGFKDILDAQSEINPADFKTRVKAAGARDYGEDVAERNIGENGFQLESPQVQAFYAQYSTLPRSGGSGNLPIQRALKTSASATGVRTIALNSSPPFSFPKKPAPYDPYPIPAALNRPKRRQSLSTYMPAGSDKGGGSSPDDDDSSVYQNGGSPDAEPKAPAPEIRKTTIRPSSPRPVIAPPVILVPPMMSHDQPTRSSKFPRDSVLVAKQRAGTPLSDKATTDTPLAERTFSFQSSRHSQRGSVTSSAIGSPRKRHSLHTLQSSISSSIASRETIIDATPLTYPRGKPRRITVQHAVDEAPAESPTKTTAVYLRGAFSQANLANLVPSPFIKALSTSSEVHKSSLEKQRGAKSLTLTSIQAINSAVEIPENSPTGTHSLRAWSTSSATVTTSDASSNSFQRPQSNHTANTSVDLSNASPSLKASYHGSQDSGKAVYTNTPKSCKSSSFNMDDYLSSDDDSFTASPRPNGGSEEGLLFSDNGYGAHGLQLPGLFDSLTPASRPVSQDLLQRCRSSPTLSPGRGRSITYNGDSFGRAAGRRLATDFDNCCSDTGCEEGGDDEYDNDDEDSLYDIPDGRRHHYRRYYEEDGVVNKSTSSPLLRGAVGATPRNTRSLSALQMSLNSINYASLWRPSVSYADEVIEEEREGKVDVAAAVKLRKEVKARKRAAAAVSAAEGRKRGDGARLAHDDTKIKGGEGQQGHNGMVAAVGMEKGTETDDTQGLPGIQASGLGLGLQLDGGEGRGQGKEGQRESGVEESVAANCAIAV
ncbi:hypothetical protein B0T17DRAFT_521375 [Bombardia bombarda]|uniref:Uncharacterized protein n=1 Tax=Bombardia bombarda TaxID=252184 RepID=A0AA40CG89_9PEZI|nr:hypothetical protein B0T17DRAFT_521375 [Bombardia bombarda]